MPAFGAAVGASWAAACRPAALPPAGSVARLQLPVAERLPLERKGGRGLHKQLAAVAHGAEHEQVARVVHRARQQPAGSMHALGPSLPRGPGGYTPIKRSC